MSTFFTRRNLAFIGYRGTGKSTIARLVANDLGILRYDLDDEVQRLAGKSIAELFLQDGESYFRDLEQAALATLVLQGPSVLSLGGGVVLREANRQVLQQTSRVVWLTASVETILSRLLTDPQSPTQRPRLTEGSLSDEIRDCLRDRSPLYAEIADVELCTDRRTPQEIVNWVVAWWQSTQGGAE